MTTLTPRAGCCRTWLKNPRDRHDLAVHVCGLAPNHPGDTHQCSCGTRRVAPAHPNQQHREDA